MNEEQNWVEALNINPENLAEWSAQAPSGKPLLVWCLEQGFVPSEEYFAWAQQRFQIPRLHSTFFATALNSQLLEDAKNDAQWSPWCFPVDNWDGVILVACVEPPPDIEGEQYRFVLAEPAAMAAAWGAGGTVIGGTAITRINLPPLPAAPFDGPSGLSMAAPKPFQLNLNLDSAMLNHSEATPPAPPAPPVVDDDDDRDHDDHDDVQVESETEATQATAVRSAPPPAPNKAPPPPPVADEEQGTEEFTNTMLERGTEPEGIPISQFVVAKSAQAAVEQTEPAIRTTQPPAKRAGTGSKPKRPIITKPPEQAVDEMIAAIEKRYGAAVIMRCSNGIATPYHGSSGLKLDGGTATNVNLSYATFMRIVARTGMPYHGYLVESPAHTEFFAAIGLKDLPGCVTAVPIKMNGELWAIVVALGTDENQKMESLHFVHELVDECAMHISEALAQAS